MQFLESLVDESGATIMPLPLGDRWMFKDCIESPDPRYRAIVREFDQAGYLASSKDDSRVATIQELLPEGEESCKVGAIGPSSFQHLPDFLRLDLRQRCYWSTMPQSLLMPEDLLSREGRIIRLPLNPIAPDLFPLNM